ncbi:MAG: hypothetical protein ABSA39_11015 [Edaphobacter sp.]
MVNREDISHDKSMGDLAREAAWFFAHSLIAAILLALAIGVISLNDPDPDSSTPKLLGTVLAVLFPMIGGFFLARVHHNNVAGHVWISGLALFSIVCVWVIGLPNGRGLCETCGLSEKIWRTFFTFNRGSGLMGGDGLLVGTWTPLSMIGYAIGAKLAL